LLHHYIQRGFNPEYLLNLDYDTKLLMMASIEKYFEEKDKEMEMKARAQML